MPRVLAPPPEPIVEGILYPGELTIVAGAPSVGKSRFLLKMLHGLSVGQNGWWGSYPPMDVLYCSQRSWRTTSAQLRSIGVDELPDHFHVFCPPDLTKSQRLDFRISPTKYLENKVIDPKNPPKVVVLDTLITYLPYTKDFNFNSYSDLTKGCDEIYDFAQHIQCAIPLCHHTAKQKTDSKYEQATEKILGSQAIMAVAISSCVLEPTSADDHTYVKASFMSHLMAPAAPRYFHGEDYHEVTYEEVSTFSGMVAEAKVALGPTEEKVLEIITNEPTLCSDIVTICKEKFGISKSQVYGILNRLAKKGYVTVLTDEDTGTQAVFKPLKM